MDDAQQIVHALGKLEAKVDAMHDVIKDHDKTTKGALLRHDERIRKVEKRQSWMMGAAAGIGAIVSAAGTWLLR